MEIQFKLIQKDIINWYQKKWKRESNTYPWRIGDQTPYKILVAEILLQHTTAKAINDNKSYQKFLEKYPDIYTLNEALKDDLIAIFQPLGLYNQKSERIKKLSNHIVLEFNGKIPKERDELLKVPLIGDYIANAILTFAYNKNEVPLDNNLKRIAFNVWELKERKDLINLYKKLAKPNPKIIYWALFDVGRFHCRKPMPNCKGCPMNLYCENIKEKKISKT